DHWHLRRAHERGHHEMANRRADHRGEVVLRVEARAEEALDLAAEHVEREHVEENVRRVRVQEAVGDELPGLEARLEAARRPEGERIRRKHAAAFEQVDADVGDQQPLRDGRHYSTLAPESRTSFSSCGASRLMWAANAAGLASGVASMPCSASFACTS